MLQFLFILCCVFALSGGVFPSSVFAQTDAQTGAEVPSKTTQATTMAPDSLQTSLKHTASGRVDKVINALTITLKDGKIVRLSSLDIPDFNGQNKMTSGESLQTVTYTDAAFSALQALLPSGTEVKLYQTRNAKSGRTNRMGHELVHIVTKKDNIWIQGTLLQWGLARTALSPYAVQMAAEMLEQEKTARKNNLQIWQPASLYRVYDATIPAEIPHRQFTVIEGKITKTASVRNNVYLNFGQNWKDDFTIMISPTMRKKLAHNGIHALSLGNEVVRVRGWVRDYNGPLIELEVAEHLEYPIAQQQNQNEEKTTD